MTIVRRINKLEEKVQPILEKLELDKKKRQEQEESFQVTNQIMRDFFPEHKWNKLDEKTKLQLENSEEILRLTIECLRWLEHNNDKPREQLNHLWKPQKLKVLEHVNSQMESYSRTQ
jgi:hypothetical protein